MSTGIAAIAVLLSWRTARQQEALSRATARRQEALTAVREWRQEVGIWASEAINVLSEAIYACEDMPENASPEDYFRPYLRRLWALKNRGRFLLPNQQLESRSDPVAAFRGYRNAALDPLWAAEKVMENRIAVRLKKDVVRNRRNVLEELEGEFISRISVILVPEEEEVRARVRLPNETLPRGKNVLLPAERPGGDVALLDEVVPRVVARENQRQERR